MKILKCYVPSENFTIHIPKAFFDKEITKGKKSDIGKKLGDVLGLKIRETYTKNIHFEVETLNDKMYHAHYLADECTSAKRLKEFNYRYVRIVEISEPQRRTVAEQKAYIEADDLWMSKQIKQMKRDTAHHTKPSSIMISRLARSAM